MPDPEANELRTRRSEGPILNATALRSTKAGLLALGIVSFALATFGPWFNLLLGYGLMVASMTVAVLGIWWADRSSHETRNSPALANGIYAKSGAALSVVALLLSAYYTGFLVLLLIYWPLWFVGLLLTWAFHQAWIDSNPGSEVRT
ncbi:MAG TPA: hypothetical protein VGA48_10175 [Thermoplasmata archaeon]